MSPMKAKIQYLCRDDDPGIQSLAGVLEDGRMLRIIYSHPSESWESEIDFVTNSIVEKKCQGLLLDFRLDQNENVVSKKRSRYTAEAVVNELRRRSIEEQRGADNSYPIILWSTAQNLALYYQINSSYNGLYDGVWDKQRIAPQTEFYRRRLKSLVLGYATLRAGARKCVSLQSVLKASDGAVQKEMEQTFVAKIRDARFAFNYAIFVLERVLEPTGPLIDRTTVCAILGIEPSTAPDVMESIIGKAPKVVQYNGVFSDSYERYWRAPLLNWLNGLSSAEGWLGMSSEKRVSMLKAELKIRRLMSAAAIDKSYGTDFDAVCAISGQPLARRDGYRLRDGSTDVWREPRFVAGVNYRALTRDKAKAFHLDEDELERFRRDFA